MDVQDRCRSYISSWSCPSIFLCIISKLMSFSGKDPSLSVCRHLSHSLQGTCELFILFSQAIVCEFPQSFDHAFEPAFSWVYITWLTLDLFSPFSCRHLRIQWSLGWCKNELTRAQLASSLSSMKPVLYLYTRYIWPTPWWWWSCLPSALRWWWWWRRRLEESPRHNRVPHRSCIFRIFCLRV